MKFGFRRKEAAPPQPAAKPATIAPAQEEEEAISPYLQAQKVWMERYGGYVTSAHQWRIVAFLTSAGLLLSIGGMIAIAMKAGVVPYTVELNKESEVVRVTRADVLVKPSANQIRSSLRAWITGARTVYTDRFALRTLIDSTYAMTLPESAAYRVLAEYHRDNNPYERALTNMVGVEVKAIVPISERTWQIEWTETTRSISGKMIDQKDWQGAFSIRIVAPKDEKQIMVNPLGMYVQQFSWTPRLAPASNQ